MELRGLAAERGDADRVLEQPARVPVVAVPARGRELAKAGADVGPGTSIVKYAAAKLNQTKTELQVEAMGHQGLGWEGEGFKPGEILSSRAMLRAKGNSIEGGTSEVNLNVIAKRVLGLRDHQ